MRDRFPAGTTDPLVARVLSSPRPVLASGGYTLIEVTGTRHVDIKDLFASTGRESR